MSKYPRKAAALRRGDDVKRSASIVPARPKTSREWTAMLPYGVWTCADGSQWVFNRAYEPIWRRRPGGVARPVSPRWVDGIVSSSWLFNDGTPLAERRLAGNAVLSEWGLPQLPECPRRRGW